MLNQKTRIGNSTGEIVSVSDVKQLDLPATPTAEKAVYVKLTPGTPLFAKVEKVSEILGTSMTQAARFMMQNGFLGFRRFLKDNLENEVELESRD